MTWARLEETFAFHPKVLVAGLAATGLYARGIAYAAGLASDGRLSTAAVRTLTEGDLSLADRLVEVGLWARTEAGYEIHDFLEYNLSNADQKSMRKAAQQRMKRHRARSREQTPNKRVRSYSRSSAPDGVAEHCVKTEEQQQEGASSSTPLPAEHGGRSKPEAMLIAEINRVSGRAFSVTSRANLTFARARLADYPLAELMAMVRWRWRTWEPEMRAQYFRPETLLNATKCESYLGSMPVAERTGQAPVRPVTRNLELERIAARERELGIHRAQGGTHRE